MISKPAYMTAASTRSQTPSHVFELPPPQLIEANDVRPLTGQERLALVDALRGLAILGVLVAYTMWNLGSPPAETYGQVDRVLDSVLTTLVDSKFVSIFAFLFGVGTAQQWRRNDSDPAQRTTVHVRRMSFLLVVGLIHAVLLRNGDILAPYAILGFVLLAARTRSNRTLLVAAVVLAVLPYVVQVGMHTLGWTFPDRPSSASEGAAWTRYWKENFEWVRYWYITSPLGWPRILALMVVGVVADRVRLMPRLAEDRRLASRMLLVALPAAAITKVAVVLLPDLWAASRAPLLRGIVLNQTYFLSAWSLAAVYIAAFALLCQRPGWPARLAWLRAVGRMAFTNYLTQALIVVSACLAFELFDTVTPTRGVLFALGVMAIQIPFSVWWLGRFEYGPVEWLWRRATYGAAFATRRRRVSSEG